MNEREYLWWDFGCLIWMRKTWRENWSSTYETSDANLRGFHAYSVVIIIYNDDCKRVDAMANLVSKFLLFSCWATNVFIKLVE